MKTSKQDGTRIDEIADGIYRITLRGAPVMVYGDWRSMVSLRQRSAPLEISPAMGQSVLRLAVGVDDARGRDTGWLRRQIPLLYTLTGHYPAIRCSR